jgi:Tol biopolymer transport system component/lipoprotein NlpI
MPSLLFAPAILLFCLSLTAGDDDARAQVDAAGAQYDAGHFDVAIRQLEPLLVSADISQSSKQMARELAAQILQARGEQYFRQGQIAQSIADFDRQIELRPGREAEHWQRGIAYYYAGQYEKGAEQFELHRKVNPEDVENAAWHFLCKVRASGGSVEAARQQLIPVKRDSRVPMAQIQQMFAGKIAPEDVLKAGEAAGGSATFYADLYVGLYYESLGQTDESRRFIKSAAENNSAKRSYMGDVARVHVALRQKENRLAQTVAAHQSTKSEEPDITESDPRKAASKEVELLSGTRQLTFEGRRAGEGYFSRDGSQLVFQSEREPGNPFFQIYLMDRTSGDIERVSPGRGKTTCAWIHPLGDKVLFASTHDDKQAATKQQAEIELRKSGKERRYSWDYDENFELYEFNRKTKEYRKLTDARGYDAEASWSPDGTLIAFTSNRRAYDGKLTEAERTQFDIDPASLNDIYIMDADGNNVRRLTTSLGYDGGPFFSPDGKRICWRQFSTNGAVAEVWTMNIDGSDKRQLTRLGAMSWAPFYHPSGEYLIFTTNRHGFANFELYLTDVEGTQQPVRVTYSKGFDGLPAFSPDGNQLAWTSSRTASGQSQLFLASWNHKRAKELLSKNAEATNAVKTSSEPHSPNKEDDGKLTTGAESFAESAHKRATPDYAAADIARHVKYLCRDELEGRFTGSRGEQLATAYVAAYMKKLGLQPAGDDGGWFQPFEFTSGVDLGAGNRLSAKGKSYEIDKDWRPLSFSGTGEFKSAPIVFAGYGIVSEAGKQQEAYDSYVHLDVKDKWVVIFRFLPENISPERRQQLSRPSQLRFKTTFAGERGARGLVVVTGPNAKSRSELVPLQLDGILAGSSLPVISVTDQVAESWLAGTGKTLKQLQNDLDDGTQKMGFELKGIEPSVTIDIQRIKKSGRNILGKLPATDAPGKQTIVVGAHVDHLGKGASSASLARDDDANKIHYGADDNASGVAAMLEIAENLADQNRRDQLHSRRDILFAGWSGEELGLLGSDHFVKKISGRDEPTSGESQALPSASPARSIYPAIAACLNLDMVGRLDKQLILQGVGSSSIWRGEVERRNALVGLPITLQDDSYLPTDASSFYMRGVPILSAFTGAHSEYHTPRDTPEKLNYDGAAQIAHFMGLVTAALAKTDSAPDYIQQSVKDTTTGGRLRAFLGTIPDYAEEVTGVLLSGVSKDSPSDKAGIKSRDIIVELAGKKIENIYDYTRAIEGLKIGEPVKIVVLRKGERVHLEITPASRD